ncbi:MAG: hypothetical protein QM504_00775 [Pseudomonadota bacterium]
MNNEMKEQIRLMSSIDHALMKFNYAIKLQEEQNLKTNKRNSRMIRYVAFIVILLFIAVLFLGWSVKQDIGSTSVYMEETARGISAMGNTITQMQTSTSKMEEGINKMVNYSQSIVSVINQKDNAVVVLSDISDSVKLMQGGAQGLNSNIDTMNYNLGNISKQMRALNKKLGMMGKDVNRMSSSKRIFPF